MNLSLLAPHFIRLAGFFVAGSELVDIFIDERSFTIDHFLIGISLVGGASFRKP